MEVRIVEYKMPEKGFTLVELLVVIAIVAILASAAMPLSRMTVKRAKEMELQGDLLDAHRPAQQGQDLDFPGRQRLG